MTLCLKYFQVLAIYSLNRTHVLLRLWKKRYRDPKKFVNNQNHQKQDSTAILMIIQKTSPSSVESKNYNETQQAIIKDKQRIFILT